MPGGRGSGPERCLVAIENGDFRRILTRPRSDVLDPRVARAMALFVAVANAQALLSRGDVDSARQAFGAAARLLPRWLQRPPGDDGVVRAACPIADVGGPGTFEEQLVVRIARLVWRDQYEIDELVARARSMSHLDALVEAVLEQLTWTYFDPAYLRARRERPTSAGVRSTSAALCGRASHLLHLGRPTARPVNRKDWRRIGEYDGLFVDALHRLALRPAVPWHGERVAADVPIRLGRRRAWEYAQQIDDYLDGSA